MEMREEMKFHDLKIFYLQKHKIDYLPIPNKTGDSTFGFPLACKYRDGLNVWGSSNVSSS